MGPMPPGNTTSLENIGEWPSDEPQARKEIRAVMLSVDPRLAEPDPHASGVLNEKVEAAIEALHQRVSA